MKPASIPRLALAAALLTLSAQDGHAAIVLQESFNYGGSNSSLVGLGSAGSGWGGSWTTQGVTYTGTPTFNEAYQPTGLTFSTLAVSGGSAMLSANGDGFLNAGRVHTASIVGTLYGSYLFRTSSPSYTGLYSVFEGTGMGIASGSAQFAIEPDGYASNNGGVITGGAYTYASGASVSANETYLALYKVTSLGGSSVSQDATMWLLRENQYDSFITGGLIEAELNSASLGSGATDVLQRATRTITGSAAFANGGLMMMQSYFATNGQFDELRVSDTSFDELMSVPEPSHALLAALGLVALILRRRRFV